MSIIGENIKKNRLRNNLSTRDLAQKIGVSHTAVNKFEKGILSPNKQMIRKMARIFKVKTQKLILDTSTQIDIKNIEFRNNEKLTRKKKELVEYIAKEELEKYSKLLEYFPENRFPFFDRDKFREDIYSYDEIEEKASVLRRNLGAGDLSVFDLQELLENNGLIILFIESVEGFTAQEGYIHDKYLFMTLKKELFIETQRYLLASELIRIILNVKNPDLDLEDINNKVTSSFLMSRDLIVSDVGSSRRRISFYELTKLNNKYKIPILEIIKRLSFLKIISEPEKIRLFNYVKKQGLDKFYKTDSEKTSKYEEAVLEAVLEKYIDYKKGAIFLNILEKDFLKIITEEI